MRADAIRIHLAIHLDRATGIVFADLRAAITTLFALPFQGGEVDALAIRQDETRLDPRGPVTGDAALIRSDEIQLLRVLDRQVDVDEARLWILRRHERRLKDRLRMAHRHRTCAASLGHHRVQLHLRRCFRRDPARRNLQTSHPRHAIQHRRAEAIIRHVREEMEAREAEAATTFRPIKGPREVLRLARLHIGKCVRIATVRSWLVALFELHRVQRRDGAEHRRHALHLRHEAHVVIPFILRGKGLHAIRHRMLARLHARVPRWVHGIECLKEAAHPVEEVFPLRADPGLHAIMNRREARAAITSRLDVQIVRRLAAVIQEHDDRIGLREVLRPVVLRIHHRKSLRIGFIDAPRQI